MNYFEPLFSNWWITLFVFVYLFSFFLRYLIMFFREDTSQNLSDNQNNEIEEGAEK